MKKPWLVARGSWLVKGIIYGLLASLPYTNSSHAANVELEITKQIGRKLDMALAPVRSTAESQTNTLKSFEQTLSFDLDNSGFFTLIKNPSGIQSIASLETPDAITQGSQWRGLGAEILVKGSFSGNDQGGALEIYAFDVASQRGIFGKRYSFKTVEARLRAHQCANDIIYQLTGERGIAGTQIAYVAGNGQVKEVFVCDYDGQNVRQLTRDGSIALGVSWHPSKTKILYTSFKEGQARNYIHDTARGVRQKLTAYPGLNASAKFSPDGSRIVSVLSKDGNPELYVSDLQGQNLKRLTHHKGVDASAAWSADGQKICFVSDRSGRPHLYMMDLAAGTLRRLTHQGAYNASPSWSPKGDKIAFSSDMFGGFKICVLDLNDETISIVSREGGEAEEPDWAPDGRHIVYSAKIGGVYQLFIVDVSDGKTIRLASGKTHFLTPAWSN